MLEVLEHGDIQFWFRPTVQAADAPAYKLGVQSLFAVLSPAGGPVHRRLRIGKKRMPARSRDRFWARVERTGPLQRVLGDLLEPELYTTKTRGERYQPAARPVAGGAYAFVRNDDHIHLTYTVAPDHAELAPDHDDGAPQVESASHLVLFEDTSGKRTWSITGAPTELDFERAEIVLVGARAPIELAAGDAAQPS